MACLKMLGLRTASSPGKRPLPAWTLEPMPWEEKQPSHLGVFWELRRAWGLLPYPQRTTAWRLSFLSLGYCVLGASP